MSFFIKKTTALISAACLMIALSGNAYADRTRFDISSPATIEYVIDGDTVILSLADRNAWDNLRQHALQAQSDRQRNLQVPNRFKAGSNEITVRIANINTEESVHRDASRNTQAGERASRFAKSQFVGEATVRCFEIGYYGRPICSVSTMDGDWGEIMIANGMSAYISKWGRHPFLHQRYAAAENRR